MSESLFGTLPTAGGPLHWLSQHDADPSANPGDAPPGYLSPAEMVFWKALKTDKRRHDWQLGRRAAKQLIANFAGENSGRPLSLDQITILPHADGWPIVTLPPETNVPAITLSISHSQDAAFCAVVESAECPLGADIEVNEARSAGFAEEYFTQMETRFLAAAPPEQRGTLTNAIWSGKEAALKAIRRGLAEDTRIVSCLPHPAMTGAPEWLPMRIVWNDERVERPMPLLSGRWRFMDQFVMTLVYPA